MPKSIYIDPKEVRKPGQIKIAPIPVMQYKKSMADELKEGNFKKEDLVRIYRDMAFIREFETMLNLVKTTGGYNGVAYNKINAEAENWAYGHGARYQEIMRGSLNNINDAERSDICYELMQYYVETNPTFGLVEFDTYMAFPDNLDFDQYMETTMAPYFSWDFNFK